jgi:hypothetical protein
LNGKDGQKEGKKEAVRGVVQYLDDDDGMKEVSHYNTTCTIRPFSCLVFAYLSEEDNGTDEKKKEGGALRRVVQVPR